MKILLSWIKEFVDLGDVSYEDIAKKLTDSGFEVEEVINKAKGLENVIAAKITKIVKHPNADKLVVCQTDIGNGKSLQIVTGATNMKLGDIVPLAQDGSNLPCGAQIKSGTIRGENSDGMFCGGDELGINNSIYDGAETYGLLILKPNVKPGTPIAEVLGLDEIIFDVKVLPNRPDCNSIMGLAREISALLNKKFIKPDLSYKTAMLKNDINVKVENFDLCSRYMGAKIINVKNNESPEWMKRRLTLLGHTPRNFFVDITNYILLEIGQPMHAFDVSKIDGNEIIVRNAKNNERIKALDGKEYDLKESNLVIADSKKPLVIAGIMGGEESGTYSETKNVFLESAVFNYASIRRTSYALGLSSDSSVRYSKGVYFESADIGMKRALNLIYTLKAGDIVEPIKDVYGEKPKEKIVVSNSFKINERLALNVSNDEMIDILNRLEISTIEEKGNLISKVPTFRTDIERECDICEEIGRVYGLDKISSDNISSTKFQSVGEITLNQKNINAIKTATAYEGFNEMISYQFISPKLIQNLNQNPDEFIKISNPIGQDYSIMRKSLVPANLNAISYNQKQGNKNIFLFELARVFIPKSLPLKELPNELNYLCLSACAEGEDFYTLKNSLNKIFACMNINLEYKSSSNEFLHPGVTADIYLYNKKIGVIGKVHPLVLKNFEISKDVYIAEIDLTNIITKNTEKRTVIAPPKFPSIERDVALIVKKDVPVANLLSTIKKNLSTNVENAYVFDVYEGSQVESNCKSVAIKFFIKQSEKTLNENELNAVMQKVIDYEIKENGAKLR